MLNAGICDFITYFYFPLVKTPAKSMPISIIVNERKNPVVFTLSLCVLEKLGGDTVKKSKPTVDQQVHCSLRLPQALPF